MLSHSNQKWKEFLFSIRHCMRMCRSAKSINHEYKLINWRMNETKNEQKKITILFYFSSKLYLLFVPFFFFFFIRFSIVQYLFIVWCNQFQCHVINVILILKARGGLNHQWRRNHLEMFQLFEKCSLFFAHSFAEYIDECADWNGK